MKKYWLSLPTMTLGFSLLASNAFAGTALKFATSVPQNSPWGEVLKVWGRDVEQKTKGEVRLDIQWSGIAGVENQVVGEVKADQVDGALLSQQGLNAVDQSFSAFEIPGLFGTWDKLEAAQKRAQAQTTDLFSRQGIILMGWTDNGISRILSVGLPIHDPSTMAGGTIGLLKNDPINQAIQAVFSQSKSKIVSIPEMGSSLGSPINIFFSSPLEADLMAWSHRVTDVVSLPVGCSVGAIVFSKQVQTKVSKEQMETLRSTAEIAAENIRKRMRNLDDATFKKFELDKTVYTPTAPETAAWNAKFLAVRQAMSNKIDASFLKALVNE